MRKILLCAALGFLAMGCSDNKTIDYAALAAKEYYDSLMAGNYGYYVDGFARQGSLPEDYREQLLVNAKQYVYAIREQRHGANEVRRVGSKADSLSKTTNVFLMLCFGDSINEEVVVRMQEKDGRWMMR